MNYTENQGGIFAKIFLLTFVVFLLFPLVIKAQVNHAPVITSTPATSLAAGESYSYTVKASDQDNDSLIFSLSSSPSAMKINQSGLVSWQETKTGLYSVVIEVSDQKGAYASQSFQINVIPAVLKSIVITPNDRPTIVVVGRTQQFQAKGYDAYNNEVTDITFKWSSDEKIGMIEQNGIFTAIVGGIGSVSAEYNKITASVGVVVKNAVANVANANANTNTNTNVNKATEKPKEESKATTNTNNTENTNQAVTEKKEEAGTEPAQAICHNWRHWIIIMILIIYGLALAVYYFFIKRYRMQRVRGWWIIPLFLTIIGEVMYFKYFCQGTYVWWPWVFLAIGVILTAYYWWISRKKVDYSQTELPF